MPSILPCKEINARTADSTRVKPANWNALNMLVQGNDASNQSHFVLRLMVMAGARMEGRTPSGATALFTAVSNGNLLCAFALLELGANKRVPWDLANSRTRGLID